MESLTSPVLDREHERQRTRPSRRPNRPGRFRARLIGRRCPNHRRAHREVGPMSNSTTLDTVESILVATSAVGAGVVGGVLFGFSTFVMSALDTIDPKESIRAMQAINVKAPNVWFMTAMFGTAAAAVAVERSRRLTSIERVHGGRSSEASPTWPRWPSPRRTTCPGTIGSRGSVPPSRTPPGCGVTTPRRGPREPPAHCTGRRRRRLFHAGSPSGCRRRALLAG